MSFQRFIFDSGKILIFIVLLLGIFRYRRFSKGIIYVFYYVLLGAISQIAIVIYSAYIGMNNMPIGHLYVSVSTLILCFFYLNVLEGYVHKSIIKAFIIGFIVFAFVNPFLIQSIYKYPNFVGAFGALILTIFSILMFSKIMTEAKIEKLGNDPLVWINTGILFFYAGSFFYNILYNVIVAYSIDFARQMSVLFAFFNIVLYGLIGIGFLKVRQLNSRNN